MKYKNLFALLLGGAALTVATPALADEGDPGRIYWNPSDAELPAIIQRGDTVCDGSPWQNACYTFFRVTNEVAVQYTLRQRRGVGVNFSTMRLVRATPNGLVMFDEAGNVVTTLSKTTAVENGPARMYQVLGAAFNGSVGSVLGPLTCEAVGGCGGEGGPTAISISGSESAAGSSSSVNYNGGNTCATGTCGYAPPPSHTTRPGGN